MGLVRGAARHYYLVRCSALVVCARRSRPVRGGWGRCRVSCLPRFPLRAPRFPRCVWRALPSGCPLSSLAGTPFHAVCAFRGLGPVAHLVFPACPVRVRALALARRPRPPPSLGWCGARTSRGSGAALRRAVPRGPRPSASPAPVPCAVWLAWRGGGGPVPFRPCLAWGCVPPFWRALGACGRGCGCGGCGRVNPSPIPQRALLRAGFARCGGGSRAPGGRASCLGVGRPG